MLLMRWFGSACGGLKVKRAGLMLLMRWFGSACGGLKVKRAGADAADAGLDLLVVVWICLWVWPEGEAGRG